MTDPTPAPLKRPRRRTSTKADTAASPSRPAAADVVPDPEPAARVAVPDHDERDRSTVISVERGGISEATAGAVDVRMGGIGRLDAEEVFVQWGGIGAARGDRVAVELGSLGAALAGDLRVTQGIAGTVVTREATVDQGIVRTLIAQRVTVTRPTAVLVMIAQHVEGDIRPLLDWRGALAAGAAFGLVSSLLRVLRGRG
jgi:hypothetical protein